MKLQSTFGIIPNVKGKGVCSKVQREKRKQEKQEKLENYMNIINLYLLLYH